MSTITPPRPHGTETWPPRAIQYLDQVAAALVGLDADEREDLLDELQAHIDALLEVEVLAHGDANRISLVRQLGTPEAFAAELLETAGLTGQAAPRLLARVKDRVRARLHAFRIPAARVWLRQLMPVWWFARGYGAAVGLAWMGGASLGRLIPIPWVLGNPITGLAATGGMIYLSVEVGSGRRKLDRRWQRRGLVAVGALALVALFSAFVLGVSSSDYAQDSITADEGYFQPVQEGLTLPNGEPVTNIYAFDREGNPLADVLLYDGAGNPLVLQPEPDGQSYPFDVFGLDTDFPRDVDGQVVPNLYPLAQYSTGALDAGEPAPVRPDAGPEGSGTVVEGDVSVAPVQAAPVGGTRPIPDVDVPLFEQPVGAAPAEEMDEPPADEPVDVENS